MSLFRAEGESEANIQTALMRNQLDIEAAKETLKERKNEAPKELYLLNDEENIKTLPNPLAKKR
jgi:predicted outer membrane protein